MEKVDDAIKGLDKQYEGKYISVAWEDVVVCAFSLCSRKNWYDIGLLLEKCKEICNTIIKENKARLGKLLTTFLAFSLLQLSYCLTFVVRLLIFFLKKTKGMTAKSLYFKINRNRTD